ncbi:MAG: acetoacetate--CoA ligase [Alphaproteobacteria bacterium]|nr:acetoacetate--CoA ligase [Alphaproteobacteria bacterium]
MSDILWTPTAARVSGANITALMRDLGQEYSASFNDYRAFHAWTLREPEKFWLHVWDSCGVRGESGDVVVERFDKMPGAKWFPEATLNYAENLLRPRAPDAEVIVFMAEDGRRRSFTYKKLCAAVSRLAQALQSYGIQPGDRVAAYVPNCPEAIIAMLAVTSLGAVFTSASPDFGVAGALDRFGQVAPKALIAVDGYQYAGKTIPILDKVREIAAGLKSLVKVIVAPFLPSGSPVLNGARNIVWWDDAIARFAPRRVEYAQVPFDHPLFIMYSSGTTGVPKCIVHGHGGSLLQHLKEHRYHCDIKPGDRVFYFTTCGWMMWNWLVTALASEATLLLFDGSPVHPNANVLWDFAVREKMSLFGTSAKYIDGLRKLNLRPKDTHDLSALRTITSTGSPLAPESFAYVYEAVKDDVHLASIAGGTDILGCFVSGSPTLPVRRGEIQCSALGMATKIFDAQGRAIVGEKGELVCTSPFPSMPTGFWNDDGDRKYRAAYFEKFSNVWTHGDWVEETPSGGFVIFGRSDATLNPGGVRIGTAEIYRQVESIDEVIEALAIGQDWDNDVRVVLFVVLKAGHALDEALQTKIKSQIRANCTPRHVPARIVQVPEIPRTKSGKVVELAVREVIHGRPVKNIEALANPESLAHFKDRAELK